MSQTHIIDNGVVVNTILATVPEAQAAYPQAVCVDGATGGIGWLWDGESLTPPPAPPAPPPTLADFDAALTAHLDATAQARRYDNRITCAVRAGYPGPFQAEGAAFALWMDNCNVTAYTLLAEVQAGTRPLPSTTQALIDLLPPMVWPAA